MNPLAANLIRTYAPILVGAVASWLAARGIHVPATGTAWAVASMTGVFSAAYYTIVRVLEERFPALGSVLLLSPPAVHATARPFYDPRAEDETSWPPRDDGVVPAGYETQRRYEPPQAPVQQWPTSVASGGMPVQHFTVGAPAATAAQVAGGLADVAAPTRPQPPSGDPDGIWMRTEKQPPPLRVRKADTGAIPTYRTPPGR